MFADAAAQDMLGPTGSVIVAAFIALAASCFPLTAWHPRWRGTATWKGVIRRSVFGSLLFALGWLIVGLAIALRGLMQPPGTPGPIFLRALSVALALIAAGFLHDLIRHARTR